MKRILIIEDDMAIAHGLEEALQQEHYSVVTAASGEKGEAIARHENIDLILLDLLLPDRNGEEICRNLRQVGIQTPILMLTSKKTELDKVVGFESGADDYMTKPFSIRELIARVKALLRRHVEMKKDIEDYSFGDVEIDFKKQEATRRKKHLDLSSREYQILKYLIQHEGEVVTREMLLNEVWGYETFPTTRTVDNYILNLRKKIEDDPSKPKHLITVHTAGYKFNG